MLGNCDVIVIFPIYGQFGATRKPDSGITVCKYYIFNKTNLASCKDWKQKTKKFPTQLLHYGFE